MKSLFGMNGLVAQFHDGLARVGALDRDIVGARFHGSDGDAGIQVDLHRDIVAGARAFGRDGRRDARGVGHAAARHVARRHHHREIERVGAGFVGHGFHVADLDGHSGSGKDIGNGLGEDVGTLLIEQAGDAAGAAGFLVDLARFVARFDEAANGAVADVHGHVVHGGIGR